MGDNGGYESQSKNTHTKNTYSTYTPLKEDGKTIQYRKKICIFFCWIELA